MQTTTTETLSSIEVKTFVSDHPELAEKKVNEWLKVNDVSIHHIGQSQSEKNEKFVFVISVFYEPK